MLRYADIGVALGWPAQGFFGIFRRPAQRGSGGFFIGHYGFDELGIATLHGTEEDFHAALLHFRAQVMEQPHEAFRVQVQLRKFYAELNSFCGMTMPMGMFSAR